MFARGNRGDAAQPLTNTGNTDWSHVSPTPMLRAHGDHISDRKLYNLHQRSTVKSAMASVVGFIPAELLGLKV